MAMIGRATTFRRFVAGFGLAALVACAPRTPGVVPERSAAPRASSRPLIAVVAPAATYVTPFLTALRSELATEFEVEVLSLGPSATTEELNAALRNARPRALVLVDDSSAALYAPIASAEQKPVPAIVVMSSFVDRLQAKIANSTAISFEIPAVTTLTTLRGLLVRPLKRAGAVYRQGLREFAERERVRARAAHIDLLLAEVPDDPSPSAVSRALRGLTLHGVDALWVSNDNELLSRHLLRSVWLPFARQTRIPIIVGVPTLVQPEPTFGTFAAVPDIAALGVQTADLVFSLQANGWVVSGPKVRPPVSVKTYLNLSVAREFGAGPDAERRVDVLVDAASQDTRPNPIPAEP